MMTNTKSYPDAYQTSIIGQQEADDLPVASPTQYIVQHCTLYSLPPTQSTLYIVRHYTALYGILHCTAPHTQGSVCSQFD